MAKRICAWCKKDIGEISGNSDSHGICGKCLETYFGSNAKVRIIGEQIEILNSEARGYARVDSKKPR